MSVNVLVTDTNGHMQYKSGQKHTQAITRVKAGYAPCQVTKKMGLNCMEPGCMPNFFAVDDPAYPGTIVWELVVFHCLFVSP